MKLSPYEQHRQQRGREIVSALSRPTNAIPFAGDPKMVGKHASLDDIDPHKRWLCLYAAAVLIKQGVLSADLSGVDAEATDDGQVTFVRADATQEHLATLYIAQVAPPEDED